MNIITYATHKEHFYINTVSIFLIIIRDGAIGFINFMRIYNILAYQVIPH